MVKNVIQEKSSVNIALLLLVSGGNESYKNFQKDIDLRKGIHSDKKIKEETEYYKYYLIDSKIEAKGVAIDKILEE